MVGLCYTHQPGIAGMLNDFMAELVAAHRDRLIGFGTVLPGEEGARDELRRALVDLDLAGIKIHCHVQKIAPDDDRMLPVFDAVAEAGKVLQIHCGPVSESKAHKRERLPEEWKAALEQLVPQMIDRPDRFLFGSDFPNLPYDPDLEVRELARYLPGDVLRKVLWDNAVALFDSPQEGAP